MKKILLSLGLLALVACNKTGDGLASSEPGEHEETYSSVEMNFSSSSVVNQDLSSIEEDLSFEFPMSSINLEGGAVLCDMAFACTEVASADLCSTFEGEVVDACP